MLPLPATRPPKPPARTCTPCILPTHIDPRQPPTRRQPFAALAAQKWCSGLDIVLPAELAQVVVAEAAAREARYAKVIMKVGDLLVGGFFTEAVKRGRSFGEGDTFR